MSLQTWINDELHQILGYSDSTTVNYFIALARKSTDSEDFIEKLANSGSIERSECIEKFAVKLLDRVPHAAAGILSLNILRFIN